MRIALIGNCQVQTIAALAERMLDKPDIRLFDYSYDYSRSEDNRRAFADQLSDCDVIFAQNAALSFTSERDLRPRYGGKLVTMANFYFRGLFPDSCYIGDFSERLSEPVAVHSVVILDAFRRGLSEAAANRHSDIDIIERLGLLGAWDDSMAEMRRREANGAIDVPAADMMEDACRRYPAFLTMNHPSAPFMADYFVKVLDYAGIKWRPVNALAVPDPLAEHDTTPILDEVADHLRLPYRVSQRWKINAMGHRHVSREEFISLCYETYRRLDPARLVVHSPTDLVAQLTDDQAHRYLVDRTAPAPPPEQGADLAATSEMVRIEVQRALRPVMESLKEISLFTHKNHSYLEIADPKVEWLLHNVGQALLHRPAHAPPDPTWPGRSATSIQRLSARIQNRLRRAVGST